MLEKRTMNVSLTPKLERYVRKKVASGLYNNASEVMREALRILIDREDAQAERPVRVPLKDEVLAKLSMLEQPLREHGITSLSLFGSLARGAARVESDVDLLIQVAPGRRFSLIDLVSVKNFLEEQLGRAVDVVTQESLDPYIRDRILREAQGIF